MSHGGFPRTDAGPSSSNNLESDIEDETELSSLTQPKVIKIVVESTISSVAFLSGGQYFVSGHSNGKARFWQKEDGEPTGTSNDIGDVIRCIAASQGGKWIIAAGTQNGRLVAWDAQALQNVNVATYKTSSVNSVDISSNGTKIVFARDNPAEGVDVHSLLDGTWVCGRTSCKFHTVKFSPDGLYFACGAEVGGSSYVSIFNSQNGEFYGSPQIATLSIAWASDSKRFFVLSSDGHIHCVDLLSQKILSQWLIHSTSSPTCISLSRNGTFIVASANSAISFWDTSTHKQIGYVIQHPHPVSSMSISPDYRLVFAGNSTIALWDLRNVLSAPYIDNQPEIPFKRTVTRLKNTISGLRSQLADAKQKGNATDSSLRSLHTDLEEQNTRSRELEKTVEELRTKLINSRQVTRAHRLKHACEILYADGRVIDAAKSLLDISRSINDDIKSDAILIDWLSSFANKCISALERIGDQASGSGKYEALSAYATALSLSPSSPNTLVNKWVSTMVLRGLTSEVLDDARKLGISKVAVYRALCDILLEGSQVIEAVTYFLEMQSELAQDPDIGNERAKWELDFQQRCSEKLEKLADTALRSQNYDEAERHYSTMLSLDRPDRIHTLLKRSHVRSMMKSWENALIDADWVIKLDPSSYQGYHCRYVALRGAGRLTEAVAAFDMMSKLEESPSARVREPRSQYRDARPVIRRIIRATISLMPRVLIDATTGHLCDRAQQAEAFEALPVFNELVLSMTREIDSVRIQKEVKEFCRYVMFSHRWERDEPLYHKVLDVTVYKLEASHGNIKLQTFCSLVRALGFRWAWSDTCCIDKTDNVVLHESLVAMFAWYRGSALTIIHLLGVSSLSEILDALRNSIWNSRVWTYQEYVAAKRVLFYTEDWEPYLGLTLENHKESPDILKEMEMSEVSSEQVAILQPGLDRIREKLYLASMREATLVEDIAYSLLGILNASIPVMYGEGMRAVGRLLEFVISGSGDATILAWTGTANPYNSCLPVDLTVYNVVVPPHIPRVETAELDRAVTKLRSSLPDVSLARTLYEELNRLSLPTMASSRLRLPCIISPVTGIGMSDTQIYHATTGLFGDIDIQTATVLAPTREFYLVHPWIHPLLDQEFSLGSARLDDTTRALRMLARLQQRFGALLFEQVSRTEYKRVAADSLIMVQFRKEVSLTELTSSIRTIEVL